MNDAQTTDITRHLAEVFEPLPPVTLSNATLTVKQALAQDISPELREELLKYPENYCVLLIHDGACVAPPQTFIEGKGWVLDS